MPQNTVISKVAELQHQDRIVSGTVLGAISAVDALTVKKIQEADWGRYAVTFYTVGTLFLHKDTLVEIVPARYSEDRGDEGNDYPENEDDA